MESGKSRREVQRWLPGLLMIVAAGCASHHSQLEQALLADRDPAAHSADAARLYHVRCPDLLEVQLAGPGANTRRCRVSADGRIDLGAAGQLRVDGLTPPEMARAIAEHLGLPPGQVTVRVVEFNSQQVYLFGEVTGQERALPYRGPETVVDLLQRAGGLAPGAAPGDIEIIRPHVADGKTPEVFHINLEAILRQHDQHSNVALEPSDQIYIGETSSSRLRPCVPPWLRPLYEALCGMRRKSGSSASDQFPMAMDRRARSPAE